MAAARLKFNDHRQGGQSPFGIGKVAVLLRRDAERHLKIARIDKLPQLLGLRDQPARDDRDAGQDTREPGPQFRLRQAPLSLRQGQLLHLKRGLRLIDPRLRLRKALPTGDKALVRRGQRQFGRLDIRGGAETTLTDALLAVIGALAQGDLFFGDLQIGLGKLQRIGGIAHLGLGIGQPGAGQCDGRLRVGRIGAHQKLPRCHPRAIGKARRKFHHLARRGGAQFQCPAALHLAIGGQAGRDALRFKPRDTGAEGPFGRGTPRHAGSGADLDRGFERGKTRREKPQGYREQEKTRQASRQKPHVSRQLGPV